MTKLLLTAVLFLLVLKGATEFPASKSLQLTPPLELKRDALMERRWATAQAALRLQDDAKTLYMLNAMSKGFILEMNKLKPVYQRWYHALSLEQKQQLQLQTPAKKWVKLMAEIQCDQQIAERLAANAALRREYNRLQYRCDRAAEIARNQD